MTPRPKKPESKVKSYMMFGFDKNDEDHVGYLDSKLQIVEDAEDAKLFPKENFLSCKTFGTPDQWLKLINEDESLNHGFKFHLVPTTKLPVK